MTTEVLHEELTLHGRTKGMRAIDSPAFIENRRMAGDHLHRTLREMQRSVPRRGSPGIGYDVVKRWFDIVLSLVMIPVFLPVMGVSALAVWLESPGPILFRQTRTGRGGRPFKMFKLRTMVRNAEELKEQYAHLNELTWPDFKITNDPRVTRVGRFLRKTSLDELPQIFNVLRGEMSLVGPRPTSFGVETYDLWHTERLEVVPGVTGLWQISGRSDIDFDDRLRLDITYIRRRSLVYDLKILLLTVPTLLLRRGAY